MREYKIKGEAHKVYEDSNEKPKGIKIKTDWRKANVGDWVEADDGNVVQILRAGEMLNKGRYLQRYVGTCTGTYLCSKKSKMDTERRKNIYSFGGDKTHYDSVKGRKDITQQEAIFAKFISLGVPPIDAYKRAFNTEKEQYAKVRSGVLLKTERVRRAVSEELDKVFDELSISLRYLIRKAKDEVDDDESRASDRLTALKMLWEAKGVVKKEKTTQVTGAVFRGFEGNQIEEIKVHRIENKGETDGEIEE